MRQTVTKNGVYQFCIAWLQPNLKYVLKFLQGKLVTGIWIAFLHLASKYLEHNKPYTDFHGSLNPMQKKLWKKLKTSYVKLLLVFWVLL